MSKHTREPVVRGNVYLGSLVQWPETESMVRFFFTDATNTTMCQDFPSLGHFEAWLAEQLGVPRYGLTVKGTDTILTKTATGMEQR